MKTINGFIFLVVAAACTACATQPQTIASHPEAGRQYPGYRLVMVSGQPRYCYAVDSGTDRKAVCLTEAQVRQELAARQAPVAENYSSLRSPLFPNAVPLNIGGMSPAVRMAVPQ